MTVIMCSLTNNDYVHQKDYPFLLEKKVKIQLRMQIGIDRLNLLKEVKTTLEQKKWRFFGQTEITVSHLIGSIKYFRKLFSQQNA